MSALILCSLGLVGCGAHGGSAVARGPLIVDGAHVAQCVRATKSGHYIMSFDTLQFASGTVRLQSASLIDPVGLTLAKAYVVEALGPDGGLGVGFPWPPSAKTIAADPRGWKQRQNVPGATMSSGHRWTFALFLAASGPRAHYDAVRVDYTSGGHSYTTDGTVSFEVKPHC